MGKRLSSEERKSIDELYDQDYKAHEIGVKIRRDTRTVKHYLNERPRERSMELERQQQELEHRNDVRRRIGNLKKRLEFPGPRYLWIPDDPETGKPVTTRPLSLDGDFVEWELKSGGYMVKLGEEFDPVIEHLRSSRRRAILAELDRWKQLGGECIEACYKLRLWIERKAGEQTRLGIVPDKGQRGLFDGFGLSIYWATFSGEGASRDAYKIVSESEIAGLCLLNYASFYNLAWLQKHEIGRIKDIHQKLITTCQNLSITVGIRQAIAELRQITDSLYLRLDDFASLSKLPGRCHLCPGD